MQVCWMSVESDLQEQDWVPLV